MRKAEADSHPNKKQNRVAPASLYSCFLQYLKNKIHIQAQDDFWDSCSYDTNHLSRLRSGLWCRKQLKASVILITDSKCWMGKPPFTIIIRAQPQTTLASPSPPPLHHTHTVVLVRSESVCQENLWQWDERYASSVGSILEPFAGYHSATTGRGASRKSSHPCIQAGLFVAD